MAAGNYRLSWEQRRLLVVLGLPAFGISLAYTVVSTYLPVLIEQLSGPAVTGVMIGGEGLLALVAPPLIGAWSDSLKTRLSGTRLGGRMPFILAGTPLIAAALIFMPLGGSLLGIGIGLAMFFVAYFVYYSPYYALFPDLVPDELRGRSQGFQGAFRSTGMLLALVGGGLLLGMWRPLPFLVAVGAVAGVTLVFFFGVRSRLGREEGGSGPGRQSITRNWELVREDRDIRLWVIANSMWEASLGALRVFTVLYFIRGLDLSLNKASGALALVGVAALVAAPLSGKLADRFGHRPVMLVALWVFGLGLLLPLFTTHTYFIAGILPFAFAAVVLMTLPYSVLMGFLSEEHHGVAAGLFGFSRGVGILLGPLLAGLAIQVLQPVSFLVFSETRGYSAMFAVASAFLLASIPLLSKIKAESMR